MKYTIAEFKKHTRKILDEAMYTPVIITRYDQEFELVGIDVPAKEQKIVMENKQHMTFEQKQTNPLYKPKSVCEHYQLKGKCLFKGCKYGKGK